MILRYPWLSLLWDNHSQPHISCPHSCISVWFAAWRQMNRCTLWKGLLAVQLLIPQRCLIILIIGLDLLRRGQLFRELLAVCFMFDLRFSAQPQWDCPDHLVRQESKPGLLWSSLKAAVGSCFSSCWPWLCGACCLARLNTLRYVAAILCFIYVKLRSF